MRILFLTNNPHTRSTTRILQQWLELMPQFGHTGCVVVPEEGEFSTWLNQHDIPCLIDPMPWPDKHKPFSSFKHIWRVAHWARHQKVDIIHCNEHNQQPFAVWLKNLLKKPIVCHVRSEVPAGFAQWAFGKDSRKPDAVLWNTTAQKQGCNAAMQGLVDEAHQYIIPLGVDPNQFAHSPEAGAALRNELGIPNNGIVLGTASSIQPLKRTADFVQLIEQLASENPRVHGVIAGQTKQGYEKYGNQIDDQIKHSAMRTHIHSLGRVSPINPFMQCIDIYVSTSEYESFGNSICEAMACGKPAVGYDGGAVGEVIGNAGWVVPIGDVPMLARDIRRLIHEPVERDRLGQIARQRVTEFYNPAKSLAKLIRVYNQITTKEQHHVAA